VESPTLESFLEALGSSAPTPGGGAASALAAALAAALAEMVAQLTSGRPKFQAVDEPARAILARTRELRAALLRLMQEDEQAYAAVAAAYRLPKGSDAERSPRDTAIQAALAGAMQPPLAIMEHGCEVLQLAAEIAEIGNPTVASDAGCAALLGEAAVKAAALNVLANVVALRDGERQAAAHAQIDALEARAADLRARAMAAVRTRMGR
jgi:formiminotetrahydrofolate cyclodeaminase